MSYRFDKAAMTVMEYMNTGELLFRPESVECRQCGEQLGVYYCERGVYAVWCDKCETLTLVVARNRHQAALRVGSPAEDRPRGMTQAEYFGLCAKGQTMRCPINGAPCNECRPGSPCAVPTKEE